MFHQRISCMLLFTLLSLVLQAQPISTGNWIFSLQRHGAIPVLVRVNLQAGNPYWQASFFNDTEAIVVEKLLVSADSVHFEMPVFESFFRLRIVNKGQLSGTWTKGISAGMQEWQVQAFVGDSIPIPLPQAPPAVDVSGRWEISIQRPDGSWRPAIGELQQTGSRLTGTIINPSGDYRFLAGEVRGNAFYMSTFDGARSYAFSAQVPNDSTIAEGLFFSGNAPGDAFKGKKNVAASLPSSDLLPGLKAGQNKLDFVFPDLDSNLVGIKDRQFANKVTIVQLMGSWCPNCMDETKFLSDFYNQQPNKEVAIISLAYELSSNFQRSAASLQKFRQRFNVQYPMLITGIRSADADKAAKTLPQLSDIKFFPTTIFIDKQGVIRKIHNGFYGPGAPAYFEAYKKEFFDMLAQLLAE